MANGTTAWRLVSVRDVRPIDLDTGKRIELPADMLPECCRCGRRHAKVYEVTDGARVRTVGSGCVKAAFDGWEPTAAELRTARASERKAVERARVDAIESKAAELLPLVLAALDALPEPRILRTKSTDPFGQPLPVAAHIVEWGNEFARVWCRADGFTAERRSVLDDATRDRIAHKFASEALPAARYTTRAALASAIVAALRG